MFKRKNTLIFGFGYESYLIVQSIKTHAEKFCMDFSRIYYPQGSALTYDNYDELINTEDIWWAGSCIFANLQNTLFQNLIKNKKKIIIVATKLNQKEAGFIDSLIKYAHDQKITLIINRNQAAESMYRYFSSICTTIDTFYKEEYQNQIYDKNHKIKPHTSILEMDALLNMSFIKQIENALDERTNIFSFLKKNKINKHSKIIEDAEHEAQRIIMNAQMEAQRILSESSLLKAIKIEAKRIKQDVIAECEEIRRKAYEEANEIRKQSI